MDIHRADGHPFSDPPDPARQPDLARDPAMAHATPIPLSGPDTISATPMPLPGPDPFSATPMPLPGPDPISATPMPLPGPDVISATPIPIPGPDPISSLPVPIPGPDVISATPIPIPGTDLAGVTPIPIPGPGPDRVVVMGPRLRAEQDVPPNLNPEPELEPTPPNPKSGILNSALGPGSMKAQLLQGLNVRRAETSENPSSENLKRAGDSTGFSGPVGPSETRAADEDDKWEEEAQE